LRTGVVSSFRPGPILSGGTVEMHRILYDPVAACAQVTKSSSYPDVAEWADYFVHARAADADAELVLAHADGAPVVVPMAYLSGDPLYPEIRGFL
jgi:hypothetical protein